MLPSFFIKETHISIPNKKGELIKTSTETTIKEKDIITENATISHKVKIQRNLNAFRTLVSIS
jgi:hypothetical protein